jgi:hypothetical protein
MAPCCAALRRLQQVLESTQPPPVDLPALEVAAIRVSKVLGFFVNHEEKAFWYNLGWYDHATVNHAEAQSVTGTSPPSIWPLIVRAH